MFIVTGASSGIGREVSLLLSRKIESDSLILISRRNPDVPNSEWIQCDLADKNELQELVKKLKTFILIIFLRYLLRI